MSLAKYRKMRDFAKTSEPSGATGKRRKAGFSYVIQKHDASHLHYDFRLELNGVLLSWAVPKGPSLDPAVKRLAMQTEDHPLDYGGFEGTIPEGAYGGGTVMVWDRGTWEPEGDPSAAYEKGHLAFQLHGEKLSGGWHLVRTQRRDQKGRPWLLFKARDEAARSGDTSLLETQANSVLSGRDLDAIAAHKKVPAKSKRVAGKSKPAAGKSKPAAGKSKPAAAKSKPAAAKSKPAAAKSKPVVGKSKPAEQKPVVAPRARKPAKRRTVEGAKPAPMPLEIEPELATLVDQTPTGDAFLHEVKFDGYRVIACVETGKVRLLTRRGEDWTERMPSLANAIAQLDVHSAILDGEFVALDDKGLSDFQLLQNSFSGKSNAPLAYYAFDLLYLDGLDLRPLPLLARKAQLKALFDQLPKSEQVLRYSEHTVGDGARFFEAAVKLGLEGVVSKRADSSYHSGRGKDWQKSKGLARQEFVIVGFTEPAGGRAHLGALLLGTHRAGEVVYSGRVGTGFSDRSLKELHEALAPLEIERPKLANAPKGAEIRGVHWVKPELVAEVAYTAITHDGLLRHPTFKGLREDKPAREVVLEQPRALASRSSSKKKQVAATSSSELSHPDRVLYPELGLTKRELAEYYELVRDWMMPHVVQRPLTLLRCPEGRNKQCFFQKHPGESLADGLVRVEVPSSDGQDEYAAIEDQRGLRALVQMGALEVHIWGALSSDADHPDRLVFDLDPDVGLDFKDVVAGAHATRDLLAELGLKSWLKTTGGKGLHVTVPIAPRADWEEVKAFCRAVAEELARRDPERYVATMSKAKRRGKIFVDYLRNGRGATFIAPYSPRAREGAGIAMPIEWDDLTAKFKPDQFTVRSAAKYLAKRQVDPFASLLKSRQKLPAIPTPPQPEASPPGRSVKRR
jgi:bifunctional non-homologous end joining protein LigD